MGPIEIIIPLVLILGTFGIAYLCFVWMKNSRASQTRMEQMQERLIRLIEEQNALLTKLVDRKG